MSNNEAFNLIGERAQRMTQNELVCYECFEMYRNGATIEEIRDFVIRLAIVSLFGMEV